MATIPVQPDTVTQQNPFEQESYEDLIARYLGQMGINPLQARGQQEINPGHVDQTQNPLGPQAAQLGGVSAPPNARAQALFAMLGLGGGSGISVNTETNTPYVYRPVPGELGSGRYLTSDLETAARKNELNQARMAANPQDYKHAPAGGFRAGRPDLAGNAPAQEALLNNPTSAADAVARRQKKIDETAAFNAANRG